MNMMLNAFTAEGINEYDPFMNLLPARSLTNEHIEALHKASLGEVYVYGYEGVGQYQDGVTEAKERITQAAVGGSIIVNGLPQRQEYAIQHEGTLIGTAVIVQGKPVVKTGKRFSGHSAVDGALSEIALWLQAGNDPREYSTAELATSALSILLSSLPTPKIGYSLIRPDQETLCRGKSTHITSEWVGRVGLRTLVRYRKPATLVTVHS